MKHGRVGFTLVELLIVISVIGILMAIFIPQIPAVTQWYRQHLTTVMIQQLSVAVDEYNRVYGAYPHDTVRWNNDTTDYGTHDVEYLSAPGYKGLFLMLQGPGGTGWGPTASEPGIRDFGPLPQSPGYAYAPPGGGSSYFIDPFGRPVLYYKARPDNSPLIRDSGYDDRTYTYCWLINKGEWNGDGTANPQRGADELPYGDGKMSNAVAQKHWGVHLTMSRDASGNRYPYNPKSYILWAAGADKRFGYWAWSDKYNGYVLDVTPDDNGADGVIGTCDDVTNY